MRVLSGIQPSGSLHLGNYFGMMSKMIAYQEESELFCFIANYHAQTSLSDGKVLARGTLEAAANFLLSRKEAIEIVAGQLGCIIGHWDAVCDEASLTETDRAFLWSRQFLNPYAFEDLDGDAASLKVIAEQAGS